MNQRNHHIYEFGPFRLDAQKRLLSRDNEIVPLKPKAFDTLLALVEGSGQVMEKNELMRRIWGDTAVEEGNLTFNISSLRKALGDDPRRHEYIVTIPGEGYRFVAGIRQTFDEVEVRQRTRVTVEEEEEEESIGNSGHIAPGSNPSLLLNTRTSIEQSARFELDRPGGPSKAAIGNRTMLAVSAVILLLILGGAAFVWLRNDKTQTALLAKQDTPRAPMVIVRLSDLGRVAGTSISPDGKFVAYAQNYWHGTGSLYVRQVDTNSESQLLEPGDRIFGTTAFSPDGAFIYYIVYDQRDPDGALYRIPVLGGHATRLLPEVRLMFTLSPDGKHVTFFRNEPEQKQKSLMVAALDGTGEQKVLTRRWDEMKFEVCPAWSPDGSTIAFAAVESPDQVNKNSLNNKLYTVNIKTGDVRKLSDETWREVGKINWVPDGTGLVFVASRPPAGNQLYFLPYPSGELESITKELNFYGNYGLGVTGDGKTLVADFVENSTQLWSVNIDGSTTHAQKLTTGTSDGSYGLTSLAADKIVYGTRTGNAFDLWMLSEADGRRDKKPLTSDAFFEREVCAAPDSSFLVFTSNRAGNQHLFRMDIDGSNILQLTFGNGFESAPDISPDGNSVIYVSQSKLWKITSSGGQPVQLTSFECLAPSSSPDGKFIACILPGESYVKNATLAVLSSDGGPPLKTFAVVPFSWNYRAAHWTPDGQALVFHKTEKQIGNLWKQRLDGSEPRMLTDFKSEMIFNHVFTRDGKRIIVSRGKSTASAVMLKNFR